MDSSRPRYAFHTYFFVADLYLDLSIWPNFRQKWLQFAQFISQRQILWVKNAICFRENHFVSSDTGGWTMSVNKRDIYCLIFHSRLNEEFNDPNKDNYLTILLSYIKYRRSKGNQQAMLQNNSQSRKDKIKRWRSSSSSKIAQSDVANAPATRTHMALATKTASVVAAATTKSRWTETTIHTTVTGSTIVLWRRGYIRCQENKDNKQSRPHLRFHSRSGSNDRKGRGCEGCKKV